MSRTAKRLALGSLAAVVVAIALAGGLLAWRLAAGPIQVAFLAPMVERALSPADGSFTVTVGDAALEWSGANRTVDVEARDLRVTGRDGQEIARLPQIDVAFSARALILERRLAPAWLEASGVRLELVRGADGRFKLPVAPSAEDGSGAASLLAMLLGDLADPASAPPTLRDLTRIGIRGATVILRDEASGATSQLSAADVVVARDGGPIRAEFSGRLDLGRGPASVSGLGRYEPARNAIDMRLQVSGLVPSHVAALDAALEPLAGVDVPISGTVDLQLDGSGKVLAGNVAARAGAGMVEIPGAGGAVRLRSASVRARSGPQGQTIEIDEASVEFADRPSRLSGSLRRDAGAAAARLALSFADLPLDKIASAFPAAAALSGARLVVGGSIDGALDLAAGWFDGSIELHAPGGTIDARPGMPEPVDLRSVRIKARVAERMTNVVLDDAVIDLAGPILKVSGKVEGLGGAPSGAVDVRLADVPVDLLGRLWPPALAPKPRRWIVANLTGGKVEEARFEVAFRATRPDFADIDLVSMRAPMRFTGVSVNYLAPMPRARGVSGSALLTNERIDITIASGAIGNIRLDQGKIALTDFVEVDQNALMEFQIQTPVLDAMQLIDGPPLGFIKAIGETPAAFSGEAVVKLGFRFPLLEKLKVEQLKVTVDAKVEKFGQRRAALGQDARDGSLVLKLDERGFEVKGQVALGGARAEVEMTRSFLSTAPTVAVTRARGRLSDADRGAFNIALPGRVDGPVDVDVTFTERRGARSDVVLDARLDDAVVSAPELDWIKPRGAVGRARAELGLAGGKLQRIDGFRIEAQGLSARGRGAFSADGKTLARLEVDSLKSGRTDARALYRREPNGTLAIDLSGASFDAGPLLRDESPADPDRPDLLLKIDLDRLYFASDRYLNGLLFAGMRGRKRWEAAEFSARIPPARAGETESAVRLAFDLSPGHTRLEGSADNAGALLTAVGISPNVIGGRLRLSRTEQAPTVPGAIAGRLEVTDFRVIRAPALARVLSVALLTGLVDALTGEGIHFSRLVADAEFDDPILTVKEARAYGASIGITGRGTIDADKEELALSGTIVPAYAINSLLGYIPLIGDMLVGGRGSGLFAATYRVTGSRDNPQVSVNPLSALAPGFVRSLFGLLPAGTPSPEIAQDPSMRPGHEP